MADNIPKNSSLVDIDILVGSDYFWDIIGRERVVLPSGLLLLSSKLGYRLTGSIVIPLILRIVKVRLLLVLLDHMLVTLVRIFGV